MGASRAKLTLLWCLEASTAWMASALLVGSAISLLAVSLLLVLCLVGPAGQVLLAGFGARDSRGRVGFVLRVDFAVALVVRQVVAEGVWGGSLIMLLVPLVRGVVFEGLVAVWVPVVVSVVVGVMVVSGMVGFGRLAVRLVWGLELAGQEQQRGVVGVVWLVWAGVRRSCSTGGRGARWCAASAPAWGRLGMWQVSEAWCFGWRAWGSEWCSSSRWPMWTRCGGAASMTSAS